MAEDEKESYEKCLNQVKHIYEQIMGIVNLIGGLNANSELKEWDVLFSCENVNYLMSAKYKLGNAELKGARDQEIRKLVKVLDILVNTCLSAGTLYLKSSFEGAFRAKIAEMVYFTNLVPKLNKDFQAQLVNCMVYKKEV